MTEPLLDRLLRDGAAADVGEEPDAPDGASAADLVAALRRAAAASSDETAVLSAWDQAGAVHRPETLDAALAELTGWSPLAFLRAVPRRRLREGARAALRRTTRAGTVRLAAAFLGALGDATDVPALEAVARHPALTLHGATALANLDAWPARLALLRLLATTDGAQRVVVIDRLLPQARQPAVRLALVRDALRGLDAGHVREVAPDIAARCRAKDLAEDPSVAEDVRAGARAVLDAAAAAGGSSVP